MDFCRYNSKGHFNVPFGRYKNPLMPEDKMISFHMKSQKQPSNVRTLISHSKKLNLRDIVYCDPPYVPISVSSNFTLSSSGGFDYREQIELAENCEGKGKKNIQCLISNHDTEFTREIYKGATLHQLYVQRNIASKGSRSRTKVSELIAVY